MGTPPPPQITVYGRPAYLNPYTGGYSPSRSYALRMQRGYARGLTQTQARRGVTLPAGYSESQVRRERGYSGEIQRQRFEQRYPGITYNEYRSYQRRYGSDIVNTRPGGISPQLIVQAKQQEASGILPPGWVENRLQERREATDNYRDGIEETGIQDFDQRISFTPIEWWYYH